MGDIDINDVVSNSIPEKPEAMLLLLDKYVKVLLIKNSFFYGFVHSIDPITNSIIILTPSGDTFQTTLIPGHAILDVVLSEPTGNTKPPPRKSSPVQTEIEIEKRKTKIIAWLKLNLLPVTESGDKIIFGNASLLPPYTVADICTNNPMVVIEMRKIMERMPTDFEPSEPI